MIKHVPGEKRKRSLSSTFHRFVKKVIKNPRDYSICAEQITANVKTLLSIRNRVKSFQFLPKQLKNYSKFCSSNETFLLLHSFLINRRGQEQQNLLTSFTPASKLLVACRKVYFAICTAEMFFLLCKKKFHENCH